MNQHLPALVTLLCVALMIWTSIGVGNARRRFGIKAPAATGHPDFERVFRVQMNTLEAAVAFLPCLWLAALYGDPGYAGGIGFLWILGRIWYAIGYAQSADRRGTGFLIGAVAMLALLGMALWGVVGSLLGA